MSKAQEYPTLLVGSGVFPSKEELRRKHDGGSLLLWAKVLELAYNDLGDKYEHPKVKSWFFSNRTAVKSFLWICDTLDLDPGMIRNLIRREYG